MGSSGLIRWGAIGLMLGGVVWLVLGLSNVFGYLQAIPGREDVVLLVLALLLTATGLVGLHALQGESYGLLGRASLYTVLISLAARALGAVVFLGGKLDPRMDVVAGHLGHAGRIHAVRTCHLASGVVAPLVRLRADR
jgi:hypothetical protein